MIYLDNAATTRIDNEVLGVMQPFLTDFYGNSGSLHLRGREAFRALQKARERVADFINASPDQIIFTSGGSESNSMVIHDASLHPYKSRIVTSEAEHDSILKATKFAVAYGENIRACMIPVLPSGIVDLDSFESMLHNKQFPSTIALVSFMHTNNELGSVNPIEEIGELCSEFNIPFHTDCVQAAGYSEIDVKKFKCDFLSLSSHKIHGPKGVGALFVGYPKTFHPLIHGGNNQEFGLRGGTENIAGIVGFGLACERAKYGMENNNVIIKACVDTFISTLLSELDRLNIRDCLHFNVSDAGRKILNLRFDGVMAETLIMMLDSQGVCVSAGSACNASSGEPSHVLKAIGLTDEEAKSSIRVSFSKNNTIEECKTAAEIIASCVYNCIEYLPY